MGHHPVGEAGRPQRPHVLHAGQVHFHHLDAQLLEGGNGISHAGFYLRVNKVEEVVGRHPRLQPGQVLPQFFPVVGHRDGDRAGVEGVIPGDGLQNQCAVADGAGHGTDVVAVEAGYQQPPLAHPSEGLLQAHHAAEGARQTHRTAQVGAQGSERYAGGYVGPAAAAGAAGDVVQSPGVVDRAVVGVVGGGPGGELFQVFLAQYDGARLFAEGNHPGVLAGHVVGQYQGTDGGADALRGEVVLDADGDSVERPAIFPIGQLRFQLPGAGQGSFVEQGYEGIELGLKPVGPGQGGLSDLDRGNLPRLYPWG